MEETDFCRVLVKKLNLDIKAPLTLHFASVLLHSYFSAVMLTASSGFSCWSDALET